MTHLGDDGGFWAADVDPGASSGDTSDGLVGRRDSGDGAGVGLLAQHGAAVSARTRAARYGPRAPRPTKLDPFKAYVRGADRGRRGRTGFRRWCCCASCRSAATSGGLTQLKVFLAPHKRTAPEPVVRFETAPGEQMQADFTYGAPRARAAARVRGDAGLQPGELRALHDGTRTATRCATCLREALAYFGGVPTEVLFDNAKTVVIERDVYGAGRASLASAAAGASPRRCGFTLTAVPAVPGEDQGQGRALQRLPEGQLPGAAGGDAEALGGLKLDVDAANRRRSAHGSTEVANVPHPRRRPGERPCDRLDRARRCCCRCRPKAHCRRRSRRDASCRSRVLQHPLSAYEALLRAGGMNLQHHRIAAAAASRSSSQPMARRVAGARRAAEAANEGRASPTSSSGC